MIMNLKMINTILLRISGFMCLLVVTLLCACEPDDPEKEDVPELITRVRLTFTPVEGAPVVAVATDPDGAGVQPLSPEGPISLTPDTGYTLTLSLINDLASSNSPEYDISAEVAEESDEHMFFFSWTDDVFVEPEGNGNIDNRSDAVYYLDSDEDHLPLGLETTWISTHLAASGDFRVVLKHQPGLKSETSDVTVGETDLDIVFDISVE
jgi:hypothetical protein